MYTPAWANAGWEDAWHFVYVQENSVEYVERIDGSWTSPVILATSSGVANPRLAFVEGGLVAVWQDGRGATPQIYSRRRLATGTWLPEECLSCDGGVSASAPALAGTRHDGMVLWQSPSGKVNGRYFDDGTWEGIQPVLTGGAWSPTVAVVDANDVMPYEVAYVSFLGIERLTRDFSGSWGYRGVWADGVCASPSIAVDYCCADVVDSVPMVAYEKQVGGQSEIWIADGRETTNLTPSGGVESSRPQLHAWRYMPYDCVWGSSPYERFFVTWLDDGPIGEVTVAEVKLNTLDDDRESGGSGEVRSLIATVRGEPYAGFLQLTESAGSIVARVGSMVGCSRQAFVKPPSLFVGPAGRPVNTISQVDACGGEPLETYWSAAIRFGTEANSGLNWDPLQQHPTILLDFVLPDATLDVGIRAGGCLEDAPVELGSFCAWWPNEEWPGVRSPDVNGDCIVDQVDRDYVAARVGGDDFCADLDGSGEVDELDVAIVDMTFGDACSDYVPASVGESGVPSELTLRVEPNPGSSDFQLRLGMPSAGNVDVTLFDSSGRSLRRLVDHTAQGGWLTASWDGKDDAGRSVPAGVYYVRARVGDASTEGRVLVVR
ncbi:MAG: FlgD immunoglobulin-like domain containing protein [Candidatus Eisenbacteria bacterium]